MVWPHLDCCVQLWSPYPQKNIAELGGKLLNRATEIIRLLPTKPQTLIVGRGGTWEVPFKWCFGSELY